jgi:hypothetical protein
MDTLGPGLVAAVSPMFISVSHLTSWWVCVQLKLWRLLLTTWTLAKQLLNTFG